MTAWAEPAPDPRVERVAERLMHLFSPDTIAVRSWAEMSETAKESWREAARQVLKP